MRALVTIVVLAALSCGVFSQASLQLQGEIVEILSSEKPELTGILAKPRFAYAPSQVFSLERQSVGNNYLFIYDLGTKRLTEIRTALRDAGPNITVEDSIRQAVVYNGQLDWRPRPDDQGQQWFAFVSNGSQNNRDIYIGFAGGSNYIRLTTNTAVDSEPKWSPDGNSIAFISNRSGNGDIYLIHEVDKIIADVNRNIKNFKITQVTDTAMPEGNPAWNPNPGADLLAYAKKESFPGREVETFQIRVINLRLEKDNVFEVTNDPLAHYTRPSWDPYTGSRLLYVGQSFLQNLNAELYVTELVWGSDKKLKNKVLEGYKTEVFKNVHLKGTPALWLAGGEAILCQEDRPEQNYPLYSVNVSRWLDKKERAVNYFEDLHNAFPYVSDFDMRKNDFLFIAQEGEFFKVYLTQVFGDDVVPNKLAEYSLVNPRTGGGASWPSGKWLIIGGAAATAGAVAYLLLQNGDEGPAIESVPIGLPPSMPGGN